MTLHRSRIRSNTVTQQNTSKIGYMRRAGMMLSLPWPDGTVSRATVRACLPRGGTSDTALRRFLGNCYGQGRCVQGRKFIRVGQA